MPMNTANKLTLLRVFLIPVFLVVAYWGFPGSRYVALAIYIVACLTDLLDGYIARHFNQVTPLGRFLDPVADKLTMATVTICLAIRKVPLRWLFGLYCVKELTLALIGLIELKSWRNSIPAKWYGKVTTALLYALMFAVLLIPDIPERVLYLLIVPPAFFIVLSFIFYRKEIKKQKGLL